MITYNNTNSRFFNLEFWRTDADKFDRFFVTDDDGESLNKIYSVTDYDNHHEFLGAIALLRSETFPGYSQMFYVYRKDDDTEINITFNRCVDLNGNYIFIKNDESLKYNDCIFCSFDRDYKLHNGYITFFRDAGV